MASIFDRKIGTQRRSRVVARKGNVPGLTGSVNRPGAFSVGGNPTITQAQKYSGSFALERPESLVGYTGGWTYGHANMPGDLPGKSLGAFFGMKG